MGYNGFPKGCDDDEYPWNREGDLCDSKYAYVTHSELNAILNYRGGSLEGTKLYVTLFPCNECAKAIIQAGIAELVYACLLYTSRWSCVILCKKVENNTKDNKSLEGGYGKRRTSDKRGTGKKTSAEKKTTSENQSAGISGSDRLGTDRAGGRFYDREIFI